MARYRDDVVVSVIVSGGSVMSLCATVEGQFGHAVRWFLPDVSTFSRLVNK